MKSSLPLTQPVQLKGWGLALLIVISSAYSAQGQHRSVGKQEAILGTWTLCTTRLVNATKRLSQLTAVDTTELVANICTEVLFQADGKGYAGLQGGAKSAFSWQQQGTTLLITYPTRHTARLKEGSYEIYFKSIPPNRDNPQYIQLELSTAKRVTQLLSRSLP